jgi:lysophospholipase L1-like esterase
LPTLWLIGDSTVRNGSKGDGATGGQWGWGAPLVAYFDDKKINVVNRAMGGTSSRSYYEGLWKSLPPLIKKGDWVILQFGANDNGGASLKGVGDEEKDGVHSFGWYLTQFVKETRAKGGNTIICSLTPRHGWAEDGHFARSKNSHAEWAAEIAKKTHSPFVDLNELISRKYEEMGPAKEAPMYADGKIHTGWDGAVVNAECVISGLKALKENPLAAYFSPRANDVAAVDVSKSAPPPVK